MSWENDCDGAGQAPARVATDLTDPAGEDRQAGHCAGCDHRFWMITANTIPPHGVQDATRPKGTIILELDD